LTFAQARTGLHVPIVVAKYRPYKPSTDAPGSLPRPGVRKARRIQETLATVVDDPVEVQKLANEATGAMLERAHALQTLQVNQGTVPMIDTRPSYPRNNLPEDARTYWAEP